MLSLHIYFIWLVYKVYIDIALYLHLYAGQLPLPSLIQIYMIKYTSECLQVEKKVYLLLSG